VDLDLKRNSPQVGRRQGVGRRQERLLAENYRRFTAFVKSFLVGLPAHWRPQRETLDNQKWLYQDYGLILANLESTIPGLQLQAGFSAKRLWMHTKAYRPAIISP
jgi:hypothetical protein